MVTIPGFTHPVADFYLEDALEVTGFQIGRSSKWARKGAAGSCQLGDQSAYSGATARSLALADEEVINYDLIEALVAHILGRCSNAGAILIFLPGAPEISRLVRALQVRLLIWDSLMWSALC